MIDYDINTIQMDNAQNPKIKMDTNGMVIQILFPSTYYPEYLKDGNNIKAIPLYQYIKYSVGGLYNIFQVLDIKYDFDTYPCDLLSNRGITILDSKDLGKSLHLTNSNYDLIPRFNEIINVLNLLEKHTYVD